MARRELAETSAGSMADIAFLLLVFFMVVTTMDTDQGMTRLLPPAVTDPNPPKIKERDIYKVTLNLNDELYVEEKRMDLSELKQGAKDFLLANGDNVLAPLSAAIDNLPVRKTLDRDSLNRAENDLEQAVKALEKERDALTESEAILKMNKSIEKAKSALDKIRAKQYASEYFGDYAALPPMALISVQNDNATSYEVYVEVNNELEAAVHELRDELCLKKFGVEFKDLRHDDAEHKIKILAIREVYPQRISEAEPLDVSGFASR